MASCIHDVLGNNISKILESDITLTDPIADTLNKWSLGLRQTNCSDAVVDWMNGIFPQGKEIVDWASDNINVKKAISGIASTLDKLTPDVGFDGSITTGVCVMVSSAFNVMMVYIDVATKAALVIYKKIERMVGRLEDALVDFTRELRNCIATVLTDARAAINAIVTKALDFDVIVSLGDQCPCIMSILSNIFNCEGDTTQEIVNCIVEKYKLSPQQVLSGVNEFIDNTLFGALDGSYNKIVTWIKMIIDTLMFPLRELMRTYCRLLTTKIDVTSIISSMSGATCLFDYTKEYKNGKMYYGMSIVDMVNSFKIWVDCFDTICSTLSDSIANKIKMIHDDLRFDPKYWTNTMMIDLWHGILEVEMMTNTNRAIDMRKFFAQFGDSPKNQFTEIIDLRKKLGDIPKIRKTEAVDNMSLEEIEEQMLKNPQTERAMGRDTALTQSLDYPTGPDAEDLQNDRNGIPFYPGVEEDVTKVFMNINRSIDRGNYFEVYMSLMRFAKNYKKGAELYNLIDEIYSSSQKTTRSNSLPSITTMGDGSDEDVSNVGIISLEKYPSYVLVDDYNENKITKIASSIAPAKESSDDDVSYYSKWFASVGG